MTRGGIAASDALTAAAVVAAEKNLILAGCFTHLVNSEIQDDEVVINQIHKFREIKAEFKSAGLHKVLFHIANSGGALNYDVSDFDFVRAGISLYGIDPADQLNPKLAPVMRLVAPIITRTLTLRAGLLNIPIFFSTIGENPSSRCLQASLLALEFTV
jgi:alanine racemase